MQLLNPSWNGKENPPPSRSTHPTDNPNIPPETPPTHTTLLHWLSTKLAEQLELDPQQIDPQTEFSDYGLNSIEAVSLSGELENFLGRRLSPTLLWDYPTLESLTQYLTEPTTQEHPAQPIHPPHQLDPIDSQEAQKMLQELDLDHLSDAEVDALLARLLSEEEG